MSIVSLNFIFFCLLSLIVYYTINTRYQWYLLLIISGVFYYFNSGKLIIFIALTIVFTYILSKAIEKCRSVNIKKILLVCSIIISLMPLIGIKYIMGSIKNSIILPLGISFYTLQIIGYCIDVYKRKIKAESNILKYALFVSFFPQIIQGPIARYDKLAETIFVEHKFDEEKIVKGLMLVIWGYFLKLVIADRAAIYVNTVYENYNEYAGVYILIAGILYSIQLYTDFSGCVCIAKGVAQAFGIEISDNFNHPYFAVSIKDFWRRWHISLSSWLRDYVYIPLGGNRKGNARKNINLLLTFLVSGFWHGVGMQYIAWGVLHGVYQIVGDVSFNIRKDFKSLLQIKEDTLIYKYVQRTITFGLVMISWIIFRASNLKQAMHMLYLMIRRFNLWVLFNDDIFTLGLDWKESYVLILGGGILASVSFSQEKGIKIRDEILKLNICVRWAIYIISIITILIFGIYGSGYDSGQFIYGGF